LLTLVSMGMNGRAKILGVCVAQRDADKIRQDVEVGIGVRDGTSRYIQRNGTRFARIEVQGGKAIFFLDELTAAAGGRIDRETIDVSGDRRGGGAKVLECWVALGRRWRLSR